MTTLGPICSFLNGGTPSRGVARYYHGDVPWITGADISGPRADTARSFITEEAIGESATNRVPAGTVLLVTRTSVGKVALAAMELCFSQDITAITPDPHCLDRSYLVHFLRTKQPHLERLARGATIKGVTREVVANLAIPLPPLAEQKRIARILDAADALRATRREALAQLDTLLQSTFLDMFGDPVTNPMGWEDSHLPDLVSKRKHALKRGPFGGALKKEIFVPEGFKVYEQKNVIYDDFDIGSYFIKTSDYERLVPFKVSPNNLLISCSGTIGSIAAVPVHAAPGVINQALLKIDLDESIMLNSFFLCLWRSQSFEQQVLGMTHGTGMKNMKSMNELKGINFPVPPIDIQHRFAAIDQSVEKQKASQRAHLAELDTLFASLQSRAFRGDL